MKPIWLDLFCAITDAELHINIDTTTTAVLILALMFVTAMRLVFLYDGLIDFVPIHRPERLFIYG